MSGVNILAARQKEELHKAIIAYLISAELPNTAETLRNELDLGPDKLDDATLKKYSGILEKKWTSVVRLQKKIMDLESRNAALQNELDTATPTSLNRKNVDPVSWLPRAPARHQLMGHREPITSVAFHPVFSVLASGSEDTSIKIWDWELGELERTIKAHTKAVLDVDFGGPKNQVLLASCSSDLTIKLWDPGNDYNNIRTLTGHDHSVSSIRFIPSSSGQHLVSASRDKTLKVWDVTTGYCIKTISGHADWIKAVTPSFDGKFLLSGSSDQTARIWDPTTGEPKATLLGHTHVIEAVAFAPPSAYGYLSKLAGLKKTPPATSSSEFCATAGRDKTIMLWDTRGTLLKTLKGHDNWVRSLVFHPGGKFLLSASDDKTIRAWDLSQDCRVVKTVEAHEHFVACIRWAPGLVKENAAAGAAAGAQVNGVGTPRKGEEVIKENIRCVIATGSVDLSVKIFAT